MALSFLSSVAASRRFGASPPPPPPPVSGDPYFYAVPLLCRFENATNWQVNDGFKGGSFVAAANFAFISDGPFIDFGAGWHSSGTATTEFATFTHDYYYSNFVGAFTIEAWFYKGNSTTTVQHGIFAKYTTSGNQRAWAIIVEGDKLRGLFSNSGSSFTDLTSVTTFPENEWVHVCLERNTDNLIRLYENGVVKGSITFSGRIFNNSGSDMLLNGYNEDNGRPDNRVAFARITRGVARYNGPFTVPIDPFPAAQSNTLAPPDIANKEYHFDASEGIYSDAGVTLAEDLDTVAQWDNQGTEENAQQTTAANRPVYRTNGLNNQPFIRCAAVDAQFFEDILFTQPSGTFELDTYLAIAVTDNIAPTGFKALMGHNSGTSSKVTAYFRDTANEEIVFHRFNNRIGNVINPQIIAAAVGLEADGGESWARLHLRQNGAIIKDGTETQTPPSTEITAAEFLRHTGLSGNAYFDGDLYEFMLIRFPSNVRLLDDIELYLSAKYGVTITLRT